MQEWYLLLYVLYVLCSLPPYLSIVWDLKLLFQCFSRFEELTSMIPMKGLQLCSQRTWLQLHFTGKSTFPLFKYFSCKNTYKFSSYIVRKTSVTAYWEGNPCKTPIWAVLNVQVLANFEIEHENNCQLTDRVKKKYSRFFLFLWFWICTL